MEAWPFEREAVGRLTLRPRGLSKQVISRVLSTLNGVTPIITLLKTYLLSPMGLQVGRLRV